MPLNLTLIQLKYIVKEMQPEGNLVPPLSKKNSRIFHVLGLLLYFVAYLIVYHKYVPRVLSFQLILIPLVLLTIMITTLSIRNGTLLIVFLIPVASSLPYFYGLFGFLNPQYSRMADRAFCDSLRCHFSTAIIPRSN